MNASKEQERESNEAEKTVQELHEQVVRLTAQLTTGEYQIRIRDAQIEDLQKAAANPMFEDSDGLPMDVDEMAYRLGVCEKRLDDKNEEIISLKAQLYDYEHPHDD